MPDEFGDESGAHPMFQAEALSIAVGGKETDELAPQFALGGPPPADSAEDSSPDSLEAV